MYIYPNKPSGAGGACPHCGYCPHCGRGGQLTVTGGGGGGNIQNAGGNPGVTG